MSRAGDDRFDTSAECHEERAGRESDIGAGDSTPDTSSGGTRWSSTYISPYAQGCDDIEQQLIAKKLECELGGAANIVRMNYCHACMSLFGTSCEDKEGFKRLITGVAQRFGFSWKFTTRGLVSTARQETKTALKHDKVSRREFSVVSCVADWSTKVGVYRNRMTANEVGFETMQEWGNMFACREVAPLLVYTHSYNVRKRKYACWKHDSTMVDGSDTVPHEWDYPEFDKDEEKHGGDHDDETALGVCS